MQIWLILLLSLTAHIILFCEAEEEEEVFGKNVEAALVHNAEEDAMMSNPVGALHSSRTRRQLWDWGMPFQDNRCEGCCCVSTRNCGGLCECVYPAVIIGTCRLAPY